MKKRPEIQTFNDGILAVYGVKRNDDGSETLTLKHGNLRYAERTVGFSRYYRAMQENVKIDLLLRVQKRGGISTQDIVIAGGMQYEVKQVQHPKGINPPCLDLSLEKAVHSYDIG